MSRSVINVLLLVVSVPGNGSFSKSGYVLVIYYLEDVLKTLHKDVTFVI